MYKRIGLIGGIGYQSTLEYYSRIMKKYNERFKDMDYPEMIIYSLSHGKFKHYEDTNDIGNYLDYIMEGIQVLIKGGADFIALAANSPHMVIDQVRDRVNIPIVSALDSAVNKAIELKVKKGLLLGIKFTMQSGFFQKRFARENISLIIPNIEEQNLIHSIIYDELMKSIIKEESQDRLFEIIDKYNIDAVVLGCMRLPIILHDGLRGVRFVDTLDLHTTYILNYSVDCIA